MKLSASIRKAAKGRTLSLRAAMEKASDSGLSLAEVEATALRLGIWPLRYSSHAMELSCDEQLRLLESTVLVAGCGGLGGCCASNLARLGTGRLVLVDPDRFDETNLNRQIFCTIDTAGAKKAEVTASAISRINPAVITETLTMPVENAGEFVNQADAVLDCLDNARSRLNLASMCHEAGVPMVHGAVDGAMGQIALESSDETVMKRLYPRPDTHTNSHAQFAFSVSAVAALQCSEILKLLLGRPSVVSNTWAFFDIREMEIEKGPAPAN